MSPATWLQSIAGKPLVKARFARQKGRWQREQERPGSAGVTAGEALVRIVFRRNLAGSPGDCEEKVGKYLAIKGKMFPSVQRFCLNSAIFST
jgi:hypothetical protein